MFDKQLDGFGLAGNPLIDLRDVRIKRGLHQLFVVLPDHVGEIADEKYAGAEEREEGGRKNNDQQFPLKRSGLPLGLAFLFLELEHKLPS
ncbi:hypothetical protein D3C81_1555480 [compost metagenome]